MKLIVITGLDGAGKTTLQRDLLNALENGGKDHLHLPHSDFVHQSLRISGHNKPFDDVWTDRLIFALDNRLVGYRLKEMAQHTDVLIMQRGWMDSFISGAVQGVSYEEIASLARMDDLPQPFCSIYLNCDPEVAYSRIADDPTGDKYETLDFMKEQHIQTLKFYDSLSTHPLIKKLFPESNFYIDTTKLSNAEVFRRAKDYLKGLGILY